MHVSDVTSTSQHVTSCFFSFFQNPVHFGLTPPHSPQESVWGAAEKDEETGSAHGANAGAGDDEERSNNFKRRGQVVFEPPRAVQDFPQASGFLQKEKIWCVTKNTDRESLQAQGNASCFNLAAKPNPNFEQTEPLCLAKPRRPVQPIAPAPPPQIQPGFVAMLVPASAAGSATSAGNLMTIAIPANCRGDPVFESGKASTVQDEGAANLQAPQVKSVFIL